MPRKQKRYHYIYKTTNKITGRYYYGMHSTNDMHDGYLGSGTRLRRSINKYGENAHVKCILEFLPNRQALVNREAEIISVNEIAKEQCMNLKPGGSGGFNNDEHKRRFHAAGGRAVMRLLSKRHQHRLQTDADYREKVCSKLRGNKNWLGKRHTEDSKKKIGEANSKHQCGSGNSQYGTCWVYDKKTLQSIKIHKDDLDTYLNNGYVKGRKMKQDRSY